MEIEISNQREGEAFSEQNGSSQFSDLLDFDSNSEEEQKTFSFLGSNDESCSEQGGVLTNFDSSQTAMSVESPTTYPKQTPRSSGHYDSTRSQKFFDSESSEFNTAFNTPERIFQEVIEQTDLALKVNFCKATKGTKIYRERFFEFLSENKTNLKLKIRYACEFEFTQSEKDFYPKLYQLYQKVKDYKQWLECGLKNRWCKSVFLRTEGVWEDAGDREDGNQEIERLKDEFLGLCDLRLKKEKYRLEKIKRKKKTKKNLDQIEKERNWVNSAKEFKIHQTRCQKLTDWLSGDQPELKKFCKKEIIDNLSEIDPKSAKLKGCFVGLRKYRDHPSPLQEYPDLKEGKVYLVIYEHVIKL